MNPSFRTSLQLPFRLASWQHTLKQVFGDAVRFDTQPKAHKPPSERILACREFGRVQLSDERGLALLEIEVAEDLDLLRNRVELRNLVARFIDMDRAHGVLAIIRSTRPDQPEYRLTFAARTSGFDAAAENFVTKETATRRFTYVLGPGETRRTAGDRLSVLGVKGAEATLEDVIAAFDVEPVGKEFFDRYKEHYSAFCLHLLESDTPTAVFGIDLKGKDGKDRDRALKPVRDFVKKLLGRLVCLHFLQKKRWLGCDASRTDWTGGDIAFLRNLFDTAPPAEKERFHSARLVPLFFDTLNTPRSGDLFSVTGTRVPYLNGGLFERDFPGVERIDFPPHLFDKLLAFFGEYHFTIDENDPEDHEIGIDPEMLGHIFENLLEDNKDKGAYYTPKAVVQYMCQQSLIHALSGHFPGDADARTAIEGLIRTKEPIDARDKKSWLTQNATRLGTLLDDLRICDPAIGSGAFPIGLLQEIYWTKLAIHSGLDRAAAKRAIIQRSIHGVDLDAGAVEIARLRFWLALIVEEDEPVPLPNLDYQIMQGNSLLESFEGTDLSRLSEPESVGITLIGSAQTELGFASTQTELSVSSPVREDLAELRKKYFLVHDPEKKAQLRSRIDHAILRAIDHELERRREILAASLKNAARETARKRRIKPDYSPNAKDARQHAAMQTELAAVTAKKAKLHTLLEDSRAERPFFLWHLWFRHILAPAPEGNGGFDIVIANPPYISAIDYKNAFGDAARDELKAAYATATGAWDIYILFFELTLRLLREDGIACLINPNKYLAAPYAKDLRAYLLAHGAIRELVDVSRIRTFRQVDVYPVVTLFGRNTTPQGV